MLSYQKFVKQQMEEVKHLPNKERMKEIGKMWREYKQEGGGQSPQLEGGAMKRRPAKKHVITQKKPSHGGDDIVILRNGLAVDYGSIDKMFQHHGMDGYGLNMAGGRLTPEQRQERRERIKTNLQNFGHKVVDFFGSKQGAALKTALSIGMMLL